MYPGIGTYHHLTVIGALNQVGTASFMEFLQPTGKIYIAFLLFALGSYSQHTCHVYLANLEKYTLPQHWLFQTVVCPHYTSECLIYLSLAMVSAPSGRLLNGTVLAGFGFVASNLAVTADSTRKWYVGKFGEEKVANRWRIFPFVY